VYLIRVGGLNEFPVTAVSDNGKETLATFGGAAAESGCSRISKMEVKISIWPQTSFNWVASNILFIPFSRI
jgi:hypothetical protein